MVEVQKKIIDYINSNKEIAKSIIYVTEPNSFSKHIWTLKKPFLKLDRQKRLIVIENIILLSYTIIFNNIITDKINKWLIKKEELPIFSTHKRTKKGFMYLWEERFKTISNILNDIAMRHYIFNNSKVKTSMWEQILFFLQK